MKQWLIQLDWSILLFVAVLMALAPFKPEPHLVEKLRMLAKGELRRPLDIFDLIMHAAPLVVVVLKLIVSRKP